MLKKISPIVIFFVMLTAIVTYPLILKINSVIAGSFTTDEPFAALWNFWWFKYAFTHGLGDNYYPIIAIPFGFGMAKTPYPVWQLFYKWLSILTTNVTSFNIQMLFSFILSAITVYYLLLYLTEERLPSLFAGIIYAFCPYHFARSWQHLGLAQIQWMPLYLLTLIKLKENPTYKKMFFCILAIFLVISFEFHYAYFMYITTILFLLYCALFYKKLNPGLVKLIFIVMLIGGLFILPTSAMVGIKQAFFKKEAVQTSVWSAIRPFEDLFSQSARPLSYFLPATVHPVFGGFTEHFIGSSLYGISLTEHTLYLGWTSLVLAFFAFGKWRRNKKLRITDYGLRITDKEDFYIGFFLFLAITAWLFSQPPWWNVGPLKIYMPSFFMYKILPMFRAYCRFGIVVMLAIAILAGYGLKFILEKFKTQKIKFTITAFFCALVLFEFWNYPPFKIIDVSKVPDVYYWLKEKPDNFTIAEYPLDINGANIMYMFYQVTHEKRIINATIPGTYANKLAEMIVRLSDRNTPGILKWMGVKYILVHKDDYLNTELIEDRDDLYMIPKTSGLKFIKSFPPRECPQKNIMCVQKTGPIDVYEVVAEPIEPKIEKK